MAGAAWDTQTDVAVIATAVAVCAVVFAGVSAYSARRSLMLAERQEARREPHLISHLRDGYARRERDRRVFAVSLLLSNPAEVDNSITILELEVRYRLRNGVVMTLRLPHDGVLRSAFEPSDADVFTIPLAIPAHGAIARWAFFGLPDALIGQADIDDYAIRVVDAHGTAAMIDLGPMRDITNVEARCV